MSLKKSYVKIAASFNSQHSQSVPHSVLPLPSLVLILAVYFNTYLEGFLIGFSVPLLPGLVLIYNPDPIFTSWVVCQV